MKKIFVMLVIGLSCLALFAKTHGTKKFSQYHGAKSTTVEKAFLIPPSANLGAELVTNGSFGKLSAPSVSGWETYNCAKKSNLYFSYKNPGLLAYNRTHVTSYIYQDITEAVNENGGGWYYVEAWFHRHTDPAVKNFKIKVLQQIGGMWNYTDVNDSYIQDSISAPSGGKTSITRVAGLVKLVDGGPYTSATIRIYPGQTTQQKAIDSVSMRKLLPTPGVARPFPDYQAPGAVLNSQMRNNVITLYEQWKSHYLKTLSSDSSCKYVGKTEPYYYAYGFDNWQYDNHNPPQEQYYPSKRGKAIAASEGMGYGMIITVLMAGYDKDAKANYDALLKTVEKFPAQEGAEKKNLMSWVVPENQNPADGNDSATDGDMDIAYSLILAYRQWGEKAYADKAVIRINAIKKAYVVAYPNSDFDGLIKIGNWQESEKYSRPSDWILDHFRVFTSFAVNDFSSAIDFIYRSLEPNSPLSNPAGLLPDFTEGFNVGEPNPADCGANYYAWDGGKFYTNGTGCEIESMYDGCFFYNACRYPWRFAVDMLHYNDSRTKDQLVKVMNFFKNTAPDQINCGYGLDGQKLEILGDYYNPPENEQLFGQYETGSLTFVAPITAAYAAYTRLYDGMYKDQAAAGWNFIKNKFDVDYYSDSINLLCVLTSSGHWWSPDIDNYCPPWQLGATYKVGDLVSYNGKVYECLQAHTAYAADWNPEQAPALWKLIK